MCLTRSQICAGVFHPSKNGRKYVKLDFANRGLHVADGASHWTMVDKLGLIAWATVIQHHYTDQVAICKYVSALVGTIANFLSRKS